MTKHLSFWIGVFVTAIAAIPIGFGIIPVAEDRAADIATMIFGALVTILFLLVFFLLFGDFFLKKLGLSYKKDLDSVLESFSNLLVSLSEGDSKNSIESARAFSKVVVSWYSWSSLYRWVIATSIALLLGFAAFAGTILIFEQIKKIEEQTDQLKSQNESLQVQNELLSLSITQEFRTQLSSGTSKKLPRGHLYSFPECEGSTQSTLPISVDVSQRLKLEENPNPSVISSLSKLTENPDIQDKVIDSLDSLLKDTSGKVALGALKTLERASVEFTDEEVIVRNVILTDMHLEKAAKLRFIDSYIDGFTCESCEVALVNSWGRGLKVRGLKLYSSWIDVLSMNPSELVAFLDEASWSIINMENDAHVPAVIGTAQIHEVSFIFEDNKRITASTDGKNLFFVDPVECGEFPYPQLCSINSILDCSYREPTQ